ncbi:MAG: hypothetical protein LBK77_02275 [Spirochaetaceae bacterium]|jgi:hypothetical protein|nr:hypothetical protein [Spirochaetaceae bacterium]
MDENTEAARLFACFNKLSAEQKKEILAKAESLLKRQKKNKARKENEGRQK